MIPNLDDILKEWSYRVGVIDYKNLLPQFQKMGYSGAFGCEYRPRGKTDVGLSWRSVY